MSDSTKLAILGAGNIAREIHHAAAQARGGRFRTVAFVVDAEYRQAPTLEGLPVLEMEALERLHADGVHFVVGIGEPKVRRRMLDRLQERVPLAPFATVIHQNVVLMPGCQIGAGVYLAPSTTLAIACRIEDHAIVNQHVSLGHDCLVGQNAVISPGCVLSGWTRVGRDSFLGSGVLTYPKVQIGESCVVSAGVVVSRNLRAGHKLILKPNTMTLPPD